MNKRQGRIARAMASTGVMCVATGVALGLVLRYGGGWPLPATIAAITLVSAAGLYLTTPWWRSIDDAARDAHKTAWYWGGSCGAAVAIASAMLLGDGTASPLVRGALLTFAVEVVGYVVFWAGWWLARRPAAAA